MLHSGCCLGVTITQGQERGGTYTHGEPQDEPEVDNPAKVPGLGRDREELAIQDLNETGAVAPRTHKVSDSVPRHECELHFVVAYHPSETT